MNWLKIPIEPLINKLGSSWVAGHSTISWVQLGLGQLGESNRKKMYPTHLLSGLELCSTKKKKKTRLEM